MDKQLISVIVPVYNTQDYLKKCVDSLLAQDYSEIEILLVDDGSSDSCSDICEEYSRKYPHIRCIHQKNQGLSAARNTGIAQAKGDYIYLIDSDDYLLQKEALSILRQQAIAYQADLVVAAYAEERQQRLHYFTQDNQKVEVLSCRQALLRLYDYERYRSIFFDSPQQIVSSRIICGYSLSLRKTT